MPRDAEKLLMKELEQAIKESDRAQEQADIARNTYNIANGKAAKARNEVDSISAAISHLRGLDGEGTRQIEDEARQKETPVA